MMASVKYLCYSWIPGKTSLAETVTAFSSTFTRLTGKTCKESSIRIVYSSMQMFERPCHYGLYAALPRGEYPECPLVQINACAHALGVFVVSNAPPTRGHSLKSAVGKIRL